MSKKLRISSRGDPKPFTRWGERRGLPFIFGTNVTVASTLAKVKGVVVREMMGEITVDVTRGINMVFMFTTKTSRHWMDLLVKVKARDRKRKHKWVSNKPATIGEWLWKELNSPWEHVKIKVRAQVDDTLPPEGQMTKKELEIIYGK
jgi:hypothetical protein